jgi:hypothetical protein
MTEQERKLPQDLRDEDIRDYLREHPKRKWAPFMKPYIKASSATPIRDLSFEEWKELGRLFGKDEEQASTASTGGTNTELSSKATQSEMTEVSVKEAPEQGPGTN